MTWKHTLMTLSLSLVFSLATPASANLKAQQHIDIVDGLHKILQKKEAKITELAKLSKKAAEAEKDKLADEIEDEYESLEHLYKEFSTELDHLMKHADLGAKKAGLEKKYRAYKLKDKGAYGG